MLDLTMTILIGAFCLETLLVVIFWHTSTKGSWKNQAAGRSLMLLLVVLILTTGAVVLYRIYLDIYPWTSIISIIFYIFGLIAVGRLGRTILLEQRHMKDILKAKEEEKEQEHG